MCFGILWEGPQLGSGNHMRKFDPQTVAGFTSVSPQLIFRLQSPLHSSDGASVHRPVRPGASGPCRDAEPGETGTGMELPNTPYLQVQLGWFQGSMYIPTWSDWGYIRSIYGQEPVAIIASTGPNHKSSLNL